ncbi:hypothetical protein EXN65_22045, partial [Clostridium botulinum]|nr:hypothetical protein [Clostridium botulinum]
NVDINIDAKDNLSGVKEIKVNDTVIIGNKYTVSNNGTYIVEVAKFNAGNSLSILSTTTSLVVLLPASSSTINL